MRPCTSAPSVNSPLSSSITSSLLHSRLKPYLFHKSFPPQTSSLPRLTSRTPDWLAFLPNTHTQPFYGSLDFIQDYPGEPVPEETFTHSHLSWSSIILYLLPPMYCDPRNIRVLLLVCFSFISFYSVVPCGRFSWSLLSAFNRSSS